MKIQKGDSHCNIDRIAVTTDTLSGRGGLALILRYIDKTGFFGFIHQRLGHLRGSSKGAAIHEIIRHILAAFIDGSDTTMEGFNRRRCAPEAAAVLETTRERMIGRDGVRRFFKKFLGLKYRMFRPILHQLFIWRLLVEKPEVIELFIDTMVLDNDLAHKREGVKPTYKKRKGFQPLQIHWGRYIIDMVFRSGEKHSNHGSDVVNSVKNIAGLIRKHYRTDVPIILCSDSGFLSDENFQYFENTLNIHYVCMGRAYSEQLESVEELDFETLPRLRSGKNAWLYYDYGSRLKSWKRFRRTIFTTTDCIDDQCVMPGIVNDSFIYTSLGTNRELDEALINSGHSHYLSAEAVVKLAHGNGASELNHRSIKEFMGTESLPFKRFGMNAAFYSLIVIAHVLTEAYQCDVAAGILPKKCYPATLRRTVIDFAAKIVKTAGRVILKVTRSVWERIDISVLWQRCNTPPVIQWR